MSADPLLPYRINFENLGPGSKDENGDPYQTYATAPAQRVTITDQLEAGLDWDTFRITDFGWGDIVVNVPADTSHYTDTIRMTVGEKSFVVEVEAGIDFSTGQVFARFQSIDPESSLPPDAQTGMLPPEDGTGCGMGHFSYTIRTKGGLTTGAAIRNIALIQFDQNEIIATNQIDPQDASKGTSPAREALITLDRDVPTSSIAALDPTTSSSVFNVTWGGADIGSGIASYDVYVSVDGGAWQPWLRGTTRTSQVFFGRYGRAYGFLSVARDLAGNSQSIPDQAQTTIEVSTGGAIDPADAETLFSGLDGAVGDGFGAAVALTAGSIVIGAPGDDGFRGSVQVFDRETGAQLYRLMAPTPAENDWFGHAVATDGMLLLVGASEAVHIYDLDSGDFERSLSTPAPLALGTGTPLGIAGNEAFVGLPGGSGEIGVVEIFDLTTGASSGQLLASDGSADNRFGTSVAILGDRVIVGAPGAGTRGAIYVFDLATGDQVGKVEGSVGNGWDNTGTALAGESGRVVSSGGSVAGVIDAATNALVRNLRSETGQGPVGSLDAKGGRIVLGFPESSSGQVAAFDGASGTETHLLTPSNPAVGAGFGHALATDGQFVLVGAPGDFDRETGPATLAGQAYLINLSLLRPIDRIPPSIFITGPKTSGPFPSSKKILIKGTATDNESLARWEYRLNNSRWATGGILSGTTGPWSRVIGKVKAGRNTFEVRAYDTNGLVSSAAKRTVNLKMKRRRK